MPPNNSTPSAPSPETLEAIADVKTWRQQLDGILQDIKSEDRKSRERGIVVTKVQEAIMWLGMDLKAIGKTPNPYPESYNPASAVIAPTADGLKL